MNNLQHGAEGPQPGADTDWSSYTGHNHLELDISMLLAEAKAVADRAQVVASAEAAAHLERQADPRDQGTLDWPPGRAGAFAKFLHSKSYSPIPEVAISATLGLLAGVCGRAYQTATAKDLSLYIILVAKSGVGKDAMHEGIPAMLELSPNVMAHQFVRAQDFASGEALHKELLREPGFLYLQGEFGRKLKRMANPHDSPMQSFRTIMLNAYAKRFLEGKAYSNPENSLLGVEIPALSFLGETTPGTFLECLTDDMMADGFLSRFIVISYAGDRPMPNRQREGTLGDSHLVAWRALLEHAVKFQSAVNLPPRPVVQQSPEAGKLLDAFEITCIQHVNATDHEAERQVWSRAHLKALKVASLLAVADLHLEPLIGLRHAEWAVSLIRRDVEVFQSRKRNGDVGMGDDARERKLTAIVRDYVVAESIRPGYKVHPNMHADGIVPRSYLQMRTSTLPAFGNHKLGASKALDETIRSLVASGHLMDVKHDKVVELYGHHGKAYRVLDVSARP